MLCSYTKLYLRPLKQPDVDALEDSIDEEVLCEVLEQAVDLKVGVIKDGQLVLLKSIIRLFHFQWSKA